MVYEKKCSNCERMIDFGGRDLGNLPDNAFEFNEKLYCKECVEEFVQFGADDINDQIEEIQDMMQKVSDQLGLDF